MSAQRNIPSKRFIAVLALIFLLCSCILGQAKREPDRGFVAGGSYALSNIETINTTNGNVMLNIPLASLPGGRDPGFTFALRYNSKLWDAKGTRNTDMVNPETSEPEYFNLEEISESDSGGWHYSSTYQLELVNRLNLEPIDTCGIASADYEKSAYIWKLRIKFPDGSVHEMRPAAATDYYGDGYFKFDPNGREYAASGTNCTTSTQAMTSGMTYYSTDGSFLRLVVDYVSGNNGSLSVGNPWTLYMPDGGKVVSPANSSLGYNQRVYDRNSNYISLGTANGLAEDQFGRTLSIVADSSDPSKHYITRKGVAGESVTMTVKWKTAWVYKTYDSAPGAIYCNSSRHTQSFLREIDVVDYVELPSQVGSLRYTFDYNAVASQPSGTNYTSGWGELNHVEMPSGAQADYQYALDGGGTLPGSFNLLYNSPTTKELTYDLEYDGSSPSVTETWLYSISQSNSYITAPNGAVTEQWYGDVWNINNQFKGMVYKQVEADGTKIERIYQNNAPENVSYGSDINPYTKTEFTSIKDASGSYTLTSARDFDYDKNGNVTEVREYDWMSYSSVPRTNDKPTGLPSNASSYLKRKTVTTVYNDTPAASSTTYNDADSYYLSTSPRLLNLVKSVEIQDPSSTPKSRSEMTYDYTTYSTNTVGGNLTQSKTWDSFKGGSIQAYSNPLTTSNSITTSATYNSYGMPLTTTDANGNVTQITYGAVNGFTDLYPTQTITAYNTSIARTSTAVYDFYTGLTTSATDEDNDLTNATEYDDLGRPIKAITAQGTALEAWTTTEYHDADRYVVVKSDLETKGDGKKVATQFFDQLGRVRLSKMLEDAATQSATNETDGIKVQTRYMFTNSGGTGYSYQLTSNPYRASTSSGASGEEIMGWTRSKTLNTGRHSEVETFSGASLPAPWGSNSTSTGMVQTDIDANATTVTDQTGKLRRSITNALGQLIRVDEPNSSGQLGTVSSPNQDTNYTYDTLNNLLTVVQGSQTRTFTYSSLSRLKSAANPESGTINYVYDSNGNLTSKIDARTIATTHTYDALNRVTQRAYTNEPSGSETPDVTYTYGTVAPAIGKLKKVESSVSTTEYTSFDILGRVTGHKQTTDATDYTTAYVYNLAGALIEETYPSTRKVKNVLDASGDLAVVESKKNSSSGYWHYADSFTYNAAGAVTSMQLGNGRWESTIFNSRLQPTQIALGTIQNGTDKLKLNYSYGDWVSGSIDATKNNGNIVQQVITVPTVGSSNGFTATQKFYYDSLNRIDDATEDISGQTWRQDFSYDRYGNRNFVEANTTTLPKLCNGNTEMCSADRKIYNPSINTSNNRLSTSDNYSFDSSGNTTGDAESRTFIYDAENKQVEVRNSSSQTIGQYWYDGDGRRVKKYVPSTGETTVFVYNATGQLIAEYSTIVASSNDAKVAYLTNDHLGSPRINTDANGAVAARHDYHPFGEEITTSQRSVHAEYASDTIRKQFTGYERDNETGLDFAQARTYANQLGRFTTPDPKNVVAEICNESKTDEAKKKKLLNRHLVESQKWNIYIYVENNPLVYADPNGEERLYTANGRYIGRFGDNDTIRIVNRSELSNARRSLRNPTTAQNQRTLARIATTGSRGVFESRDEAAVAWAQQYNRTSVSQGREYASTIYTVRIGTELYVAYSEPTRGTRDGSTPSPAPTGTTAVADIHSHGQYDTGYRNNEFSGGDTRDNDRTNLPGYVSTPDGSLLQYDPDTRTITPMQENIPSDQNDPLRRNRIN